MSDDEDFTKALALDSDSDESLALDSDNESLSGDIQDIIDPKAQPKQIPQSINSLLELDEESINVVAPAAKKAKAGSFASFGLGKGVLANITKKGYRQPTPIQRKTIPLIMEGRDVVGMARTGSGKTAAFTLPLVEKLKTHSAKTGIRAIILSPSRELAMQTHKQVREFSRGTDLRSIVLIGGDSLEDQFASMMGNPDVVVATPGRFLHLKVEMGLDLKTVEYVCFDEADRLFEMGFAEQLNELLAALPPSRQTLLFSATLPRTLVDFAKAGLASPVLVRLDAETKVSDQLQMAFIATKRHEREANLLHVLEGIIGMKTATKEEIDKLENAEKNESESEDEQSNEKNTKRGKGIKRRLKEAPANVLPHPQSTIVFVPTKHHVEYVTLLLRNAGYLVSYIYGTLDQRARRSQLTRFRAGLTTVLVVTDVAARGIDIPVLANVINYTLPGSSKIFVHRVGRTARAGNAGWAYSLVSEKELPYLLDLELFLGRKVLVTPMHEQRMKLLEARGLATHSERVSYVDRLVIGSMPRAAVENMHELCESLLQQSYELRTIRDVAAKGEKLFYRTRQPASAESVKRSKELLQTGWDEQHLLVGPNLEREKELLLQKLADRKCKETVFEFRKKNDHEDGMAAFMHRRRRQIAPIQRRARERRELLEKERAAGLTHGLEDEIFADKSESGYSVNEAELAKTFEDGDAALSYKDPQFYMSHYAPASVLQDQQLSISSSFANDAAKATFDLGNDEKMDKNQVMQWDKKKGKYVNSLSTDKKYIVGESGNRIPASYRSGRFDEWRKSNKSVDTDVKLGAQKFKHNQSRAPKLPDKFRDDYNKQKKKVQKAVDEGKRVRGWNVQGQKSELRSVEQIRRGRNEKERRREKNGRHKKKAH